MNARGRVARTVAIGACAALLLVAWYFFAPRQIGGRAAYVTTAGTSMEPLLRQGDLALVYPSSQYRVGDVIAYRNPDIHRVVLHRIVALDGDRFVLQGDNNTWIDSFRPGPAQVLGAMAYHVPGLGRPLAAARSPWGISALVSVGALVALGGRRRYHRTGRAPVAAAREHAPAVRARSERAAERRHARIPSSLVGVLGGVAILSLASTAAVYALPLTATEDLDVAFEQTGTFSYTAPVGEKGLAVYGRDHLETGDPVYLELTDAIDLRFDYALETDGALELAGSAALVAEISDVNGWSRTIPLAPEAAFDGPAAAAEGTLDLAALRAMVTELERVTGIVRNHYTITVRPRVSVDGTLAGQTVAREFAPELRFLLDPLQLQLEPEAAAPIGEEDADPLNPVSSGLVTTTVTEPRSLSLLGLDLGLETLRLVAAGALVVSVLGLGIIALLRLLIARRGEPAVIEARYGRWLVPVHDTVPAAPGRTVQVESFDSLARLANHYGHVVLHEAGDGFHAYSIEESGVTYRYLAANGTRP
jgi:signal peptidase I